MDVSGPQEALKDVAQLSGLSSWPVDQVDLLSERELVAPVPFALAVEAHARGTTTVHRNESHVAVALLSVLHRLALTCSGSGAAQQFVGQRNGVRSEQGKGFSGPQPPRHTQITRTSEARPLERASKGPRGPRVE